MENGTSWLLTSLRESQCFVSEKNICEYAIVCVKIVAEYREYVLLETVTIQDTQHGVFFSIQYLYPDETRPETRKRLKKWADLREAKVGEPLRGAVEDFFDLGFAATIKPIAFHGLYIVLYLWWKA